MYKFDLLIPFAVDCAQISTKTSFTFIETTTFILRIDQTQRFYQAIAVLKQVYYHHPHKFIRCGSEKLSQRLNQDYAKKNISKDILKGFDSFCLLLNQPDFCIQHHNCYRATAHVKNIGTTAYLQKSSDTA